MSIALICVVVAVAAIGALKMWSTTSSFKGYMERKRGKKW